MEIVTMERLKKALDAGDLDLAKSLASEMSTQVSAETVTICNITEQDWGPYNSWQDSAPVWIQGKKPGKEYSLYVQRKVTAHIDIGDGKSLPVEISAKERADDIVRMVNGDAGHNAFFGVFSIAGEIPTKQELTDAHKKYSAYCAYLVERADTAMQAPNGYREVSELHRRAARYLGVNKPWLQAVEQLTDCPACKSHIRPGAAVCPTCHAILDREAAEKFGLVEPIPEAEPKPRARKQAQA